jgi:hypothetical protein
LIPPLGFPTKIVYEYLLPPSRVILARPIILHFITRWSIKQNMTFIWNRRYSTIGIISSG